MAEAYFLETAIDNVNEGIIAVDKKGTIISYNKKAKEIFGIIYVHGIEHKAGNVEKGDIVVIADSSLGEDDGGLKGEDFKLLGISNPEIPKGSGVVAAGVIGGNAEECKISHMQKHASGDLLYIAHNLAAHSITASVDFRNSTANITVDGQEFPYEFIKSIGHMVIVSGKTGKVKFYQAKGYTFRREDIKSVLMGKPYLAKGDSTAELDLTGCSVFEVHPRESNIDIIEFLEAAKGKKVSYSNKVKEINGRPTRCSLIQVKSGSEILGAILKIEDITELKNVIDERDNAIATLNEVENRLKVDRENGLEEIIGQSESIKTVKKLVKKASETDSTVLLLGESGTGKGLIADSIHKNSKRKNGRFVYVNCASIPESLLESELFGYEGGSFTGAKKEGKAGLFEAADGGTIFLDEIGDLPLFIQAKLLHVLQNKSIRRVGGIKDTNIDVKIITATNKDLERAVEEGSFRNDLYYRINVFPIYIPPLRMRREDIFPLIHHILPRVCEKTGHGEKRIAGEAIKEMISYDWPGNVRELENVLERAVNIADGHTIFKEHINLKVNSSDSRKDNFTGPLSKVLEDAEYNALKNALAAADGNKNEAMKILGIGKTSFYEKIKKYNIL